MTEHVKPIVLGPRQYLVRISSDNGDVLTFRSTDRKRAIMVFQRNSPGAELWLGATEYSNMMEKLP